MAATEFDLESVQTVWIKSDVFAHVLIHLHALF